MKLVIFDHEGERHEIAATDGLPAMEIIRDAGLSIAAQCGGCASCATCHVYVDAPWQEKLPPASEEEAAMLEMAQALQPNSRLSCQIRITPELDQLSLRLAPGSEY